MYRRSKRRPTRRQVRSIGLLAFLRRPIVQLTIVGIAVLIVVVILLATKPA